MRNAHAQDVDDGRQQDRSPQKRPERSENKVQKLPQFGKETYQSRDPNDAEKPQDAGQSHEVAGGISVREIVCRRKLAHRFVNELGNDESHVVDVPLPPAHAKDFTAVRHKAQEKLHREYDTKDQLHDAELKRRFSVVGAREVVRLQADCDGVEDKNGTNRGLEDVALQQGLNFQPPPLQLPPVQRCRIFLVVVGARALNPFLWSDRSSPL
mmetsp:Transcript_59324/g.165640  ORF Transcript_59324/g.165640 Transcript_59324/m.165640 type:complete len:211 (-) Transcript_59324:571-1203(-)